MLLFLQSFKFINCCNTAVIFHLTFFIQHVSNILDQTGKCHRRSLISPFSLSATAKPGIGRKEREKSMCLHVPMCSFLYARSLLIKWSVYRVWRSAGIMNALREIRVHIFVNVCEKIVHETALVNKNEMEFFSVRYVVKLEEKKLIFDIVCLWDFSWPVIYKSRNRDQFAWFFILIFKFYPTFRMLKFRPLLKFSSTNVYIHTIGTTTSTSAPQIYALSPSSSNAIFDDFLRKARPYFKLMRMDKPIGKFKKFLNGFTKFISSSKIYVLLLKFKFKKKYFILKRLMFCFIDSF